MIKADIRRVLDRMQVQYRDTKGGYECIHLPSIDLTSVEMSTNKGGHQLQPSSTSGETSMTPIVTNSRPSIVKKASKLSLILKRDKDKGKEKDHSVDNNKDKDREAVSRPSGATNLTTPSSESSSFINVSSNHTVVPSQDNEMTPTLANGASVSSSSNGVDPTLPTSPTSPISSSSTSPATTVVVAASNKAKVLPPIPRDFALPRPASPLPVHSSPSPMPTGEVDRDVFESMGNNSLSVRFEINIVKVSNIWCSFLTT